MGYSKSILAVSSSLKSLNTSSSDSFLWVGFEELEPFVWFELLFDEELFDEVCPLIDDDKLSAISAVAKRWTYSERKNIHYERNRPGLCRTTYLWLFSYNHLVCEGIALQHRHLTDPPDLDRQVIVEEMIQKYWRDLLIIQLLFICWKNVWVYTIHWRPRLINYIETNSTGPMMRK